MFLQQLPASQPKRQYKKKREVDPEATTDSEVEEPASKVVRKIKKLTPVKARKQQEVVVDKESEDQVVKKGAKKRSAVVTRPAEESGSDSDLVDKEEDVVVEKVQREVLISADEVKVNPVTAKNYTGTRQPLKQIHPPPPKAKPTKKAKKSLSENTEEEEEQLDSSVISVVRERDPPNAPVRGKSVSKRGAKTATAIVGGGKRKVGAKELLKFADEDEALDHLLEKEGVRQVLVRKIEKRQASKLRAQINEEVKSRLRGSILQVLKDLK